MKQLNFIRIELTHFDFSRERSKYVFDKWFEQIRFNFVPYLNQTGRKQEKKTFIKRVCVASICIFRLENTFSTIERDFFGFSSARRKKWKKKKDTPNFETTLNDNNVINGENCWIYDAQFARSNECNYTCTKQSGGN